MPETRISVHHRVNAIDQLERTARYLNLMATWLGEQGLETEADMVDASAKGLLASCWMLDRPLRMQLPPQRWQQPEQAERPV